MGELSGRWGCVRVALRRQGCHDGGWPSLRPFGRLRLLRASFVQSFLSLTSYFPSTSLAIVANCMFEVPS